MFWGKLAVVIFLLIRAVCFGLWGWFCFWVSLVRMGVWLLNLLVLFYMVLILFFEVFRLYMAPLFVRLAFC
jgi:hypothetical protein